MNRYVAGTNTSLQMPIQRYQFGIGYLPQKPAFHFRKLTVWENLMAFPKDEGIDINEKHPMMLKSNQPLLEFQ